MQTQELYEYAVIRAVPRVEREEFINAGIIVFCKQKGILHCKTSLAAARLQCLSENADVALILEHLQAFAQIANGTGTSPIAALDAASRFRWLTATRSTIIQCSKVHPGLANDFSVVADALMAKHVI